MARKGTSLPAKRRRFVHEYLKDGNGTNAAKRAGYAESGAHTEANRLLKNVDVRRALKRRTVKLLRASDVTAERVIREAARIAFVDRRGFMDRNGNARGLNDLTADEAACIDGFEIIVKNVVGGDGEQDIVHKYKLAGKVGALELLMRHLGILDADTAGQSLPSGPCFILPPGTEIAIK